MLRSVACAATAATVFLHNPTLFAADEPLTLERALSLARERSPAVIGARLQIEEARGRRVGAGALFAENPSVSGAVGRRMPREPGTPPVVDGRVELVQPIELGGGRGARVAAADAAVAAQAAASEGVLREVEAAVTRAFMHGLHARDRRQLALAAEETAARSAQALERRLRAGDVAALEVNLARTTRARATAELRASQALEHAARGELVSLLGLEPTSRPQLVGDLRAQRRYDVARLLDGAKDRPQVRELREQARVARADQALGRAERWPRLGLGAAYERDGGDDVVLGTLSLSLPLFQRGQGVRASAAARARRLALEAEAGLRSGAAAVRAAHLVHEERLAAVRALEEALPLVQDSEELARKSYEGGQLGLAEWLVVRREALETRREHLDRLLEAAEAGIALALIAGVSP